jgi:phosphoribosylglycinamide formyltransferase-1
MQDMPERLISEAIKPLTETADTSRMAIGEPGLPRKFVWRGRTVTVTAVLRSWRETGNCRHGSPERYVRKHWFEVVTASDGTMKLYFERQPRGGRKGASWWLLSIREPEVSFFSDT